MPMATDTDARGGNGFGVGSDNDNDNDAGVGVGVGVGKGTGVGSGTGIGSGTGRRLRLALADDQALVRSGLRALLSGFADVEVVVEACDGAALLQALDGTPVDVVLSDVRMPGMDGFAVVEALQARDHAPPVLLLTTFDDEALALRAAEAGARGFLLKDASPDELLEAIRRLAAGDSLLAPVATDPVRARYRFHDDHPPRDTFNDREVAILRLIAGGCSNREIARSLFLAEGTVKNYVSTILEKLGTRDRTRAVLKAITLRVI